MESGVISFEEACEKYNIYGENTIDECPVCNKGIILREVAYVDGREGLFIIADCPNEKCGRTFVTKYEYACKEERNLEYLEWNVINYCKKVNVWPSNMEANNISDIVKKISFNFVKIYEQAEKARKLGLSEICGVGYRKALEFLIKDYCVSCNKEKDEKIKKMTLGKVIENYVENPNIKSMAKRAVWLGNDETHYIRKWEDKDVDDLIKLIDLTTKWIDLEVTTKKYQEEMEKPKK